MDSTFVSEMIGTGLLILLGDGVVAAVLLNKSKAQNSGWIVITFGWSVAVMIGVFAAWKHGAHLNPAVTIGQGRRRRPGMEQGTGVSRRAVRRCGHRRHPRVARVLRALGETEDPGLKLAVFSTGPAIRNTIANLMTEIIGTFVLVFGVYAIFKIGGTPGDLSVGLGPVLVALLVLGIGLSLGGPTGYAINPARDLGPRIIHAILPIPGKGGSDWSYAWVPVVGPLIGGAIGGILGAARVRTLLNTTI